MLVRIAAEQDVRLIVDTSGPPLEAATAEGVYLIKPSRDELAELEGADRNMGRGEQLETARDIVDDGRAEVVALSLSADGALLVWAGGVLRLPTPRVDVLSAVGAGDAFLAGLVLRLAEGRPIAEAFRTAVAAGSATAMMPATELCHLDDVVRLENELAVA
jgi:6-phosphofructokinase 2